ncbi:MAG TPA: translocation/assembly module TamB domain-containing protein, partial [Polyangiaceae bacterium]|nr:translocation/assembly module TamB domain-containing protein [Polyangiaceae bacterium]
TPSGGARLRLDSDQLGALGRVVGIVEMRAEEQQMTLAASAKTARFGAGHATFRLPSRGAFDPTTWHELTGSADAGVSAVPLTEVTRALGFEPELRVSGTLSARAQVSRSNPTDEPTLDLTASTNALELASKSDQKARELSQGFDLSSHIQLRGGVARVGVQIHDRLGTAADGEARIPFRVRDLSKSWPELLASLRERWLVGHVSLGPRRVAGLPKALRPLELKGKLRAQGLIAGTLGAPSIRIVADGAGLSYTNDPRVPTMDVRADVHADASSGAFGGSVEAASDGKRLARATLDARAPLSRLFAGDKHALTQLRGSTQLQLSGLPLQMLAPDSTATLRGKLHGVVRVERQRQLPEVSAGLRLVDAGVNDTMLEEVALRAFSDSRDVTIGLRGKQGNGDLKTSVVGRLSWNSGLPRLDREVPLRAELTARGVRASLFKPLLGDVVSELDGLLGAEIVASLAHSNIENRWRSRVDGSFDLRDGKLQIAALGDRLAGIKARAKLVGRDGRATLVVSDLYGRAGDGRELRGQAQLQLDKRGLRAGTGRLRMTRFPITLDGVTLGETTGSAAVRLRRNATHYELQVVTDRMLAELTDSGGDNVQALDAHPSVIIGQPKPMLRDPATMRWEIRLDATRTRVRLRGIDITLSGQPTLTVGAAPARLTGSIVFIPGGRVPLFGKLFTIESGRVVFDTGNAKNPHVFLTAKWAAQDGTTIFIDLTGTLKKARLALRSDPAMAQPEILARLLGGSGDVALASAIALRGVTQMLENTPLEGVQLRAKSDSTRSGAAAAIRMTDGLWLEGAYTQETDSNEIGPQDNTDAFTSTLDWRFSQRWSLRTELGNAGSAALDLVWRFRY